MSSFVRYVVVLTLGLCISWFWMTSDRLEPCPNPSEADPVLRPECYFSPNYVSARSLFLEHAQNAGARIHDLLLPCGLSIDVAIVDGDDPSKLLLHFSGTHGVEGYLGSAIQSASLNWLVKTKSKESKLARTVIFIHGLNPYGMANFRRVNEHNVDLNRNAHFVESRFRELTNRDPNIAGYDDWDPLLNPATPPNVLDDFAMLASGIKALVKGTTSQIKRALVTGTYTKPKGIFYGGERLQPSHSAVRGLLSDLGYLGTVKDLIILDVHAGLGPFGNDTFMTTGNETDARSRFGVAPRDVHLDWRPPFAFELQTQPIGATKNVASEGYDLVSGDTQASYPELFTKLDKLISVTQEFGTVAPELVAYALIKENQAFHYGTKRQHARAASFLKDMFCPSSQSFANLVIPRGMLAVIQSVRA